MIRKMFGVLPVLCLSVFSYATTTNLRGVITSPVGTYTGYTTYQLVDEANAPASLIVSTLAVSGFVPSYVGPGFFGTSANGLNVSSQPVCEIFTATFPVAVDSATVFINTGLGAIDVGIYDTLGNRVASTGVTSIASVTGRLNIPFTSAATLNAGNYWECIVANGTGSQFSSAVVAAGNPVGQQTCTQNVNNYPLPVTLTFPCTGTRSVDYNLWVHPVGSTL